VTPVQPEPSHNLDTLRAILEAHGFEIVDPIGNLMPDQREPLTLDRRAETTQSSADQNALNLSGVPTGDKAITEVPKGPEQAPATTADQAERAAQARLHTDALRSAQMEQMQSQQTGMTPQEAQVAVTSEPNASVDPSTAVANSGGAPASAATSEQTTTDAGKASDSGANAGAKKSDGAAKGKGKQGS
jgi:hypothetical protein